jgi:hypothetical protein
MRLEIPIGARLESRPRVLASWSDGTAPDTLRCHLCNARLLHPTQGATAVAPLVISARNQPRIPMATARLRHAGSHSVIAMLWSA